MNDNPVFDNFAEPGPPPERVYKYLPPVRLDVLQNRCIRFTPLISTNDVFEIRRTFENVLGPKFLAALDHEIVRRDIVPFATDALVRQTGLSHKQAATFAPTILTAALGPEYDHIIKSKLSELLRTMIAPSINKPDWIDKLITSSHRNLLALSLTDDPLNEVMWAHYSEQGCGFVVGLESRHSFFSKGKDGKRRRLMKINYHDTRFNELIDDPYAALVSKGSKWSYECEWRLISTPSEADRTISLGDQDIHLFELPDGVVTDIIFGHATPQVIVDMILDTVKVSKNEIRISRAVPKKLEGRFDLRPF